MDKRELTCIICPIGCRLSVDLDDSGDIVSLEGHQCKRGETYVRTEILDPVRILTSIVRLDGGSQRMCPIRTSRPIPREMLREMARACSKLEIHAPVAIGEVVVHNIMGSGADVIVTRNID